jgi:hypothetical protein
MNTKIRLNAPKEDQTRLLNKFKKRTINITEMQPRQNLMYFEKKLKNFEFRNLILHDRVEEVLKKFERMDAKRIVQFPQGNSI